jgi:enamine deaminase RidA (YjgF/YER057c/UK114 family)
MIFVSGLTSRDENGEVVHVGDIKAQSEQVFKNLGRVLEQGGATLSDVIKVTVFLCRRADFPAFHEVRRAAFRKDPPASSAVIVCGLIDERTLVEVEAVAFVPE